MDENTSPGVQHFAKNATMEAVTEAAQIVPPSILAVVVLYRVRAEESATLRSLADAFAAHPDLGRSIQVLLWDNTPGDRPFPSGFESLFHHDPSNPGLAAAYNHAFEHAQQQGTPWLLTLDQDTHLTADFLDELLSVTRTTAAAAILPRLTCNGRIVSPFRPRTQGPAQPLEPTLQGHTTEYLQAFNSGAALSTAFLAQVRGFDSNFPLDYLDHATFARLHHAGGAIHVLHAGLEHELSSQAPGPLTAAALAREQSVLAAERRYTRAYGNPAAQRMYPIRLLRRAASVLIHRKDVPQARLILRTLLGDNQ